MLNIFVGLIFIFFQPNLHVVDMNPLYYATNVIGYISVIAGVKELALRNEKLLTIIPYIAFMIFHSVIFFLLNWTGYSPLTLALSTPFNTMIALIGLGLVLAGKFIIFHIIYLILENLPDELSRIVNLNRKAYNILFSAMVATFILASIGFVVFNFMPTLSALLMGILLICKLMFLMWFYLSLLREKAFN